MCSIELKFQQFEFRLSKFKEFSAWRPQIWVQMVAWGSGNTFYLINEVTLRRAGLVLAWVIACGQVNPFGM